MALTSVCRVVLDSGASYSSRTQWKAFRFFDTEEVKFPDPESETLFAVCYVFHYGEMHVLTLTREETSAVSAPVRIVCFLVAMMAVCGSCPSSSRSYELFQLMMLVR